MKTIKEKIEVALSAEGYTLVKHMAGGCTHWQNAGEYNLYVGVSGSLRTGRTRTTSCPVAEKMKQIIIERGNAMLEARKDRSNL